MKIKKLESFEMAVGGDDFDGEIAAMRAEQKARAARKARFALLHKLFDEYMDPEHEEPWIDSIYRAFEEAQEATYVTDVRKVPSKIDGQKVSYKYSVHDYDIFTDPYGDYLYIVGTKALKEDLEDDFDILQAAQTYKCRLSSYDLEEASDYEMLLKDMESVWSVLQGVFDAATIRYWKFVDTTTGFGYKIFFNNGTNKVVEIKGDSVVDAEEE